MAQIELVYWPLRGLGQPVATLLEYLKLPYKYTRVEEMEQWQKQKAELIAKGFLFANLPYIRDGDVLLAESQAIMCYVCKKAGKKDLLPSAKEKEKFHELTGAVNDFKMAVSMPLYTCKSKEELTENIKTNFSTRFASRIDAFAKLLGKSEFLWGKLTYIDFVFAESIELLLTMQNELKADILPQKEVFEKYLQRVNALPGVAEYRHSDRFQARPFGSPSRTVWN